MSSLGPNSPSSASASRRKRPHLRGSPLGGNRAGGPRGWRGAECEGPQLGSVTHWHYWCWADDRSGFPFSFSTHTWALGKPPEDWHLDAVGRALAWGLDTLGPGSTVDLLGDLVSHFASAALSFGICKRGALFPTLPASPVQWGRSIARALKRLMGRQGVIMALASNPLNSLKTRERGQETERGGAACNPCQMNLASRAAGGGWGRGGRTGDACHPALTGWSIRVL